MPSATNTVTTSVIVQAKQAVAEAATFSWAILKEDGHWNGELKSNASTTAEQIFLLQSLPHEGGIPDADKYMRYLLSEQQDDGSWGMAPDNPGDVSVSCEVYLALKILGMSVETTQMQKARTFIVAHGGVAQVRVFTRFFLAMFGLFPWDATPQLPVELIFAPNWGPVTLYRMSSWARSTVVPFMLIAHHRPVYALPNGRSACNTFLDELWTGQYRQSKMVPLGPSLPTQIYVDPLSYMFASIDRALRWFGGLRMNPLRGLARRRCVQWIVEHQEPTGDLAGIMPSMHAGVYALVLEGYGLDSRPVQLGLAAIERFTKCDETIGKRLQPSVSPVWDTVLMIRSLCDVSDHDGSIVNKADERLHQAALWTKARQHRGPQGDWRIYRPDLEAGGWSFEYHNSWYPDIDDTAAALLAFVRLDGGTAVESDTVARAVNWLCGMQNDDGGWAAFDVGNDHLWLNHIPFDDMNALCDPSTADVTGRIVEALGLLRHTATKDHGKLVYMPSEMRAAIDSAATRGIAYLKYQQETSGAWYGRWGANYIYGTSNVLCGLAYFANGLGDDIVDAKTIHAMMTAGADWLRLVQNDDGGWGESLESYRDASCAGRGPSMPSQTAWALMGLLTVSSPDDEAVLAGIAYLLRTQTDRPQGPDGGASWPEKHYTGTGFPNCFYLGYTLYRHYFPMMALGRFIRASEAAGKKMAVNA